MPNAITDNTNIIADKRTRQRGYTLLEMAVAMTIAGIMIGTAIPIYEHYNSKQKEIVTNRAVSSASYVVGAFRSQNGRYACPAPLNAVHGDEYYGREGDCTKDNLAADGVTAGDELPASLDPGECEGGYCAELSERWVDLPIDVQGPDTNGDGQPDPDGVDDTAQDLQPTVYKGALPFRDLNLPEEEAYDGYGNRVTYVVTANLTNAGTFNTSAGGISILDEEGHSLTQELGGGHFLVLSHGANGRGAYNKSGRLVQGCNVPSVEEENEENEDEEESQSSGGEPELENCDHDAVGTGARYINTEESITQQDDHYDDRLNYFSEASVELWQTSVDDRNDIHQRPEGFVGIGDPDLENGIPEISGDLRVQGRLQLDNLCGENAQDDSDCFEPGLITGDSLRCPEGRFMVGIRDGEVLCEDVVSQQCSQEGSFATGFDGNGELVCSTPGNSCAATQVQECGQTINLPAMAAGSMTSRIYVPNTDGRSLQYRCEAQQYNDTDPSHWRRRSVWGNCTCYDWSRTYADQACGEGYEGTYTRTEGVQCLGGRNATGTWYDRNDREQQCACVGGTNTWTEECPAGFNQGMRRFEQVNTCSGNTLVTGSSRELTGSDNPDPCRCEPYTEEARDVGCGDLAGERLVQRQWVCPGGPDQPGQWLEDQVVSDTCTCEAKTVLDHVENCGEGYSGEVRFYRSFVCNGDMGSWQSETVRDDSGCQRIPDPVCRWYPSEARERSTGSGSARVSDNCECGSRNSTCYAPDGNGAYWKYFGCQCRE